MNGRLYDPVLGRVLSPDNYVQNAFGTQDYNRYTYAHNNPLLYNDPDGNNPLIGALAGGVAYTLGIAFSKGGFKNWSWFGFSMSVVSGAIMGGFASEVGASLATASNLSVFAKGAIQAGAYAFMGGTTSYLSGGDFLSGAAGGAAGSVVGSFMVGLTSGMNSFWSAASTIGASSLTGGVGAELSGGDFWRGAVTSGLTAAFNHAAHRFQEGISERRERFAKLAEKYWKEGSTRWSYDSKPTGWKCNVCTHDILEEAGMGTPAQYSAGYWGDPDKVIPGWEVVLEGMPQRGDIAAYAQTMIGATGHMGIMRNGKSLIYTNSQSVKSSPINASAWAQKNWIFRRYIGTK